MSSTRATSQVMSAFLGTFVRKYDQTRKSPKNSQKYPKLKVIIHAFGLSRGPSSERHGMLSRAMGPGGSLEWSHVAWNEYMDAFTFFSRQFCVSREMNKCGIRRFFEAMQMVLSTHATLQVMSALIGTFQG